MGDAQKHNTLFFQHNPVDPKNYSIDRLKQQLASVVRLTLFCKFLKTLREDTPLTLSGKLIVP